MHFFIDNPFQTIHTLLNIFHFCIVHVFKHLITLNLLIQRILNKRLCLHNWFNIMVCMLYMKQLLFLILLKRNDIFQVFLHIYQINFIIGLVLRCLTSLIIGFKTSFDFFSIFFATFYNWAKWFWDEGLRELARVYDGGVFGEVDLGGRAHFLIVHNIIKIQILFHNTIKSVQLIMIFVCSPPYTTPFPLGTILLF